MKQFTIIWLGELISILGSGLTNFALGVWIYQRTGSTTLFALFSMLNILPAIVLSPLAGSLVDRLDRRWILILSNLSAGLVMLLIALMFSIKQPPFWPIYLLMALMVSFSTFGWYAFSTSITQLVPAEKISRASGMVQIGYATGQILSPVLAGLLLSITDISKLLFIDVVSFLIALIAISVVKIPKLSVKTETTTHQSIFQDSMIGWNFITRQPGLVTLLVIYSVINFFEMMVMVLFTPFLLSFTTPEKLGIVMTTGGLGMLAGSIMMSVWRGPKSRIKAIAGVALIKGLILCLSIFRPAIPLAAFAAFIFLFSWPIINNCYAVIWQTRVKAEIQGRVFAVRNMISLSTTPLAIMLAGPLTEKVLQPLLDSHSLLTNNIGKIIGVGEGRAIALLYLFIGILSMMISLAIYRNSRLKMIEQCS